jgi:hypothetical protein
MNFKDKFKIYIDKEKRKEGKKEFECFGGSWFGMCILHVF